MAMSYMNKKKIIKVTIVHAHDLEQSNFSVSLLPIIQTAET